MYYDTRELRSLSILRKIKNTPSLLAVSEKDFFYACASIVSHLILSNQPAAKGRNESSRQIDEIQKRARDFSIPVNHELLALTHYLLSRSLETLNKIDLTDLLNYIVDRLIELITGLDHRHCKIVSGFAGFIFNHTRHDVIDVLPNIADLTLGVRDHGIKYSFLMSGQIAIDQKELINLKLNCNSILPRFVSDLDEFSIPNTDQAYLIDAISQEAGRSNQEQHINKMTSEEIYKRISEGSRDEGFYILTRTARVANSAKFKHQWSSHREKIEAIIAFDSYYQGRARKFLFIIINNTPNQRKQTLYINISDNPAIISLDAIERSILAAAIYLSWRFESSPPNNTPQKVTSILNSQFRNGYRDINGLCKTTNRTPAYSHNLFNVNKYVNFTHQTSPTADYNSLELIEKLSPKEAVSLYIIGNNGAGKSVLLGNLATQLIEEKRFSTGITLSQSNRFPNPKDEEHFSSFSPTKTSRNQLIDMIPKSFSRVCCDTNKLRTFLRCLELLSFTQDLFLGAKPHSKKRATVDIESLITISSDALENDISLREVHQDSSTLILVKKNNPDHYVFFSDLSSGEQNVITLLTLCIDSAKYGKVLLLDEPEISLHVSWQQLLPQILDMICQELQTSIVTATHSPLLISNTALEHTYCYVLEDGKLNYIEPKNRRSVETSLVSIFNTYTPLNKEIYERCARLVALTIQRRNSANPIKPEELSDSLKQLEELEETVKRSSVINQDNRHKSDLELISKARVAIMAVRDEDQHGWI